jgi:hypothetical protein
VTNDSMRVFRLGPDVEVLVKADSPSVVDYLAEFYPSSDVTGGAGRPAWTILTACVVPPGSVSVNAHGVGYKPDLARRSLTLWSTNEQDLAITARKCVREAMVEHCELRACTVLHASTIYNQDAVVVFAADKRAGKTTLALRAVLDAGWSWLSNDHLIIYPDDLGELVMTSLPTLIPVKVGTFFDLEDQLPPPWDTKKLDLQYFRALSPQERYESDAALYYIFSQFGQANPAIVPLAGRRVTVVFPHYRVRGGRSVPEWLPSDETVTELIRHLRVEWVDQSPSTERYLPLPRRTPGEFLRDGRRISVSLAQSAACLRWGHDGDPAPVLSALASGGAL